MSENLYPSVASIEKRLKELAKESSLLKRQLRISKAYEDGQKSVSQEGEEKQEEAA